MISIVVCHRNPKFLEQFKKSVSDTIGIPYEIVIIDNITNKYNIFQAYNEGIKQSKYDLICFAHEDIIFHSNNWGEKVISHFKNPKIGIIGVVGSHYLPKLPGSHWSTQISSGNITHTINGKTQPLFSRYLDNKESSVQAVILDGLWLCISRTVIKRIRFDDAKFSGFHCYDSDICLQIKKLNYEVHVIFDLNIEHLSVGKRDVTWLNNIFYLYNKWEKELPICTIELSKQEISWAHFLNAQELIEQIRLNKLGLLYIIKTWVYYLSCNPPITKMNWILTLRLFNERLYFILSRLKQKIKITWQN